VSRPVIVGIDGSGQAEGAATLGRMLSEALHTRLLVVCCYGYELRMMSSAAVLFEEVLRDAATTVLGQAANVLEGFSSWDATALLTASPVQGLLELAESEDAMAIVVGSSHRGGVGRALAGSVGTRLVQSAPCAVAVAPRGYRDANLGVIGVAYDETAEAQSALRGAVALASGRGAQLRLLSVVEPPSRAIFAAASPDIVTFLDDLRGLRRDQLRRAEAMISDGGLSATSDLLEGAVVETLAEQTGSFDLLAVGSRRYGPLRRIAAGSVSIGLLRGAACPVLVLPRDIHDPFGASGAAAEGPRA